MSYQYMVVGGPLDWWDGCMTAKELFLNICSRKWDFESVCHEETISEIISKIKQMEVFIECAVEDFYSDHEKPHTVMFFPLPNLDCETLETEICAVAKQSNNGTTFVFTNNLKFAEHFGMDIINLHE